ncbi:hypothetical protein TYRP_008667 [Tyrophagus putrescentiae]|nr:hypothetical protein TYRP_008667 [Tyrophagus putrescentiae]
MKSQLANTPTVVTVRPGPRTAAMAASNGHRHTVDGSAAISNAIVGGVGSIGKLAIDLILVHLSHNARVGAGDHLKLVQILGQLFVEVG